MVETLPSNAGSAGSIPGQGAKKNPTCLTVKKSKHKLKQYYNKFHKDFKNSPHQKVFKNKRRLWPPGAPRMMKKGQVAIGISSQNWSFCKCYGNKVFRTGRTCTDVGGLGKGKGRK